MFTYIPRSKPFLWIIHATSVRHPELTATTHLMLMRYCAKATASGFPEMVIVRSDDPLSRSSQFDMRIMAPEICLISAILVPPLPMMQPISSFGTVISCVCWFVFCWFLELEVLSCEPAKAAKAKKRTSLLDVLRWQRKRLPYLQDLNHLH